MKKHLSKKAIALFLSVLMLVSSAPIVAFAQGTTWTRVASTKFSTSTWGDETKADWHTWAYNYRRDITGATYNDGDKSMNWSAIRYSGAGAADTKMTLDGSGLYIGDGYTYMNYYSGGIATPITGAESFKIDLEYTIGDDASSVAGKYGFLMVGESDSAKNGKQKADMNDSSWAFAQDLCGPAYAEGETLTNFDTKEYNLTNSSTVLQKGSTYHYIVTYNDGYFHAYITDQSGKLVQNLWKGKKTIDTSKITNIALGDDNDNSYCEKQHYNGITFYTGTKDTTAPNTLPKDVDKYLFAYFTGNDSEYIRFAVSDDGENFEALNGNRTFINQTATESYPKGDGVPDTGSGTAATGHARDPYIFRAEDGTYYMLATDMDSKNGTTWSGNSKIMCWHIEDLSNVENVEPWNIDFSDIFGKNVDRAWAPQAIWDSARQEYMLYLSIKTADNASTQLYYVYTPDFKTFTSEPQLLIANTSGRYSSSDKTVDTIDGDITYDSAKNLYYLFYKNDNSDDIYWATSANINGPYAGTNVLNGDGGDKDLESLEGVQVYKNLANESYYLIADTYGNPIFAQFNGNDLDEIYGQRSSSGNINHLSPRHGSVTYITTADYGALSAKYGKETYDSSVVPQGADVNDYLVGRYFTNSDVTYDAAEKNGRNTLTNVGVTAVTTTDNDGNTIAAAKFSGGTNKSSTKEGGYAYVDNTTELLQGIEGKTGITFSWYGWSDTTNIDGTNDYSGHFFDWSTAKDPGTLAWDADSGSQNDNAYTYVTAANSLGVNNKGSNNFMKGYLGNDNLNKWHLYTMTITDSYIHYFVDGTLLKTVYSKDMKTVSKQGTPLYFPQSADEGFNTLLSGNLYLGISSYAQDYMLNGYISDFRVYNRALSASDITQSLAELNAAYPTTELDSSARSYFDPYENTTVDSTAYTAYDNATVTDPNNIHGQVGSFEQAGGIGFDSHYTYAANGSAAKGYTISMYYNPGETVEAGGTIFSVGKAETGSAATRSYFELAEDGSLHYAWEEGSDKSSLEIANVFGDKSLTANKWNHIVMQVQPDGDYDIIYTYIDGQLVSKVNTYTSSKSLVKGKAIHNYLAQEHTVDYGKSNGGYSSAANGFIDTFSIYGGVYSASDIYFKDNSEIADTLLDETIKEFEEKMKTVTDDMSTVFTNMGTAYDIYDQAQRYKAAVEHGEKVADPEEISQLYTKMSTALNSENMKEYSKPATVQGLTTDDGPAIDAAYTQNLLSTVDTKSTEKLAETDNNFCYMVSKTNFVWLYDTDATLTAPVNAATYRNTKLLTTIKTAAIYVNSGDIQLNDLWHFDEKTTYDNTSGDRYLPGWYISGTTKVNSTNVKTTDNNMSNTTDKWKPGSDVISYTGSGPSETAHDKVNSYYTSTIVTFAANSRYEGTWSGYNTHSPVSTGKIYIISYVPVKEALFNAERMEVLSHIYDYDPASAQELLDAYDALTSQSYLFDSVNADNVQELANTLCEGVKRLENVDLTKLQKKADYTELINTAKEFADKYADALQHKDEYTTDAWNAFESAYNAVKEHFTSLDPFGDDQSFVTKQSTVTRLANNIKTAYEHLTNRADYSPVDTKVADGTEYTVNKNQNNTDASGEQKYTYNTYSTFSESYDAAQAISSTDASVKKNTPKYLISYKHTDAAKDEYGPYIAYDKLGNVVTSDFVYDESGNLDLTASGVDKLIYVGTYYDSDADGNYTENRLEEGKYIKDGKAGYVNVENARFNVNSVSDSELSSAQKNINHASDNLVSANGNLAAVADYSAYNAAVNVLKHQDMAAFTEEYRANIGTDADQSVYGVVTANGTKDATVTYANGVSTGCSITTPSYKSAGASAYVLANDQSFKDFSTADQDKLDTYTAKILSDLNEANTDNSSSIRSSYTVTLTVKFDDGTEDYVTKQVLKYGNTYSVDLGTLAGMPEGYNCYRWSVESCNSKQDNIPASQTYNLKINSDTQITAYCSKKAVEDNYVKVQIYDKFGCLVQEHNVANDTKMTLNSGAYTIADATFNSSNLTSLENTPYYTFNHWTVGGKDIANGAEITVGDYANDSKIVRVNMLFDQADEVVTVSIDGNSEYYRYDSYTTVKAADGAYGIAAEINGAYYAVSYTDSYSFLTSGDLNFYSIMKSDDGTYTINGSQVTDNQNTVMLDNKLPFVYSIGKLVTVDSNDMLVMYSGATANTLGTDVEITEMGTLYTTDSSVVTNPSSFVIGADGVTAVPAKHPSSNNQFMVKISNSGSGQIYARAYVKYKCHVDIDGDGEYEATTVQTITYGNICHN